MSYPQALQRVERQRARDGADVNALCRTELAAHGRQTPRAMVFLHGFTNCPRQFHELGRLFFERGYNVYIPRLPHHGLTDRLTPAIGRLTQEELIDCAAQAIDIGRGLGEHVTLAGISAGAVAAAWAAQHRADLHQAVLIAPSLALQLVPRPLTRPFAELGSRLPAVLIWWNRRQREKTLPAYGYPRFATRSLAHVVRLGLAVRRAAQSTRPLAGRIILVTNANDPAVDNGAARALAEAWQQRGAEVARHEFAADLGLLHDVIDPRQPGQQVDLVYPKLIEWMEPPRP